MSFHALSSRVTVLRIRGCVFVAVVVMSVLWVGLLSADAFAKGGYRTAQETAAVITLLTVNVLSPTCIPILALLDYSETAEASRWFSHVWFEGACMCALLVLQTTAALVFTVLSPAFRCDDPRGNADHEGQCELLNVYISIASWITPLILLAFLAYFGLVASRAAKRSRGFWHTPVRFCAWDAPKKTVSWDPEPALNTPYSSVGTQQRASVDRSTVSVSASTSRTPSSHLSSWGSYHSTAPLVTRSAPPRRASQPPSPPRRPPASHPPSARTRTASQPPPAKVSFHVAPARYGPPAHMLSRPLPLAAARPTVSVQIPSGRPPRGPVSAGASSMDRYCEEWNRERRVSARPAWLG